MIFFDEFPMCKASFSNRKCIFIVSVYKEFHKRWLIYSVRDNLYTPIRVQLKVSVSVQQ